MNKTRYLTVTAMLGVISAVLMFFEFPLPFLPSFLKLDLSDVPALIGAFVLGPVAAVAIVLIKDLIHLLCASSTAGVGELADFIISGSLVLTAGLVYKIKRNNLFAILGAAAGVLAMIIFGAISNYYLILPFYEKLSPLKQIFAMCAAVNPLIVNTKTYIIYAVAPFNFIKGTLISFVTLLLYNKLSVVINKQFKKM